jgi:transposase InsO family protein
MIDVCSEIRTEQINTLCGQGVQCLQQFLSTALDGRDWLTSDTGRLRTGTLWTVDWLSPSPDLDVLDRCKIFWSFRDSNPGLSIL